MILHYYKSAAGNFGDDLNRWLWDRLLPDCWSDDDGIHFAGIGTIIQNTMPAAQEWVVLGSGAGYGPPPAGFGGSGWSILSVRGPLSAEVLRLPPDRAITDGALLLNQLPEYEPLPESARDGIVFVPHHHALDAGEWPEVCRRAGVEFLDPTADSKKVVARLRRARLVIADAMHAAIISDSLRVPWLPVATSLEINTFKWLDWTQSMGLPYEPIRLPQSTTDESVRSAMLRLHGQQYFVWPPSVSGAVKHYHASVARKERSWWPSAQFAGERLYFSITRRAMRGLHAARMLDALDEARLDSAAETLRHVSTRTPYLSSDLMWRRRTVQLSEQVERLRAMLQPSGRPQRRCCDRGDRPPA